MQYTMVAAYLFFPHIQMHVNVCKVLLVYSQLIIELCLATYHTNTNFKPNHLCSLALPLWSAINKEIQI